MILYYLRFLLPLAIVSAFVALNFTLYESLYRISAILPSLILTLILSQIYGRQSTHYLRKGNVYFLITLHLWVLILPVASVQLLIITLVMTVLYFIASHYFSEFYEWKRYLFPFMALASVAGSGTVIPGNESLYVLSAGLTLQAILFRNLTLRLLPVFIFSGLFYLAEAGTGSSMLFIFTSAIYVFLYPDSHTLTAGETVLMLLFSFLFGFFVLPVTAGFPPEGYIFQAACIVLLSRLFYFFIRNKVGSPGYGTQ